jgi:hypothetical protein
MSRTAKVNSSGVQQNGTSCNENEKLLIAYKVCDQESESELLEWFLNN